MTKHQSNNKPSSQCSERPDCFGKKKCHNDIRVFCSFYFLCLEEFILRKLKLGWSPTKIRKEIKEFSPCNPDHIILTIIGKVAVRNGFRFGYKTVKRAIDESSISKSLGSRIEAEGVRIAFGVYGRKGRETVKKVSVGNTEGVKTPGEAHPGCEA